MQRRSTWWAGWVRACRPLAEANQVNLARQDAVRYWSITFEGASLSCSSSSTVRWRSTDRVNETTCLHPGTVEVGGLGAMQRSPSRLLGSPRLLGFSVRQEDESVCVGMCVCVCMGVSVCVCVFVYLCVSACDCIYIYIYIYIYT